MVSPDFSEEHLKMPKMKVQAAIEKADGKKA